MDNQLGAAMSAFQMKVFQAKYAELVHNSKEWLSGKPDQRTEKKTKSNKIYKLLTTFLLDQMYSKRIEI